MPYRPQAAIWSPNPAARSPLRAAVVGFAPVAAGLVIASVASMKLVTRLGRKLSLAGIIVTVAGVGWLLLLVAGSMPTALSLAPAMAVIGLGMGAAFAASYDIAIGPAIITTIYFGALRGGQTHAMTVSLGAVIGIGVLSAMAVPLLPRRAQAGH